MSTAPGHADAADLLFHQTYGRTADGVWAAPGRVNLVGEHTDYNDGFVLPLALPQHAAVAGSRRADGTVRVHSSWQEQPVSFSVDVQPGDVPDWAGYVAGMLWSLRGAGYQVGGADLAIVSDVPVGAGLSSSAALECSVGVALCGLHGIDVDPSEMALIAQKAENDYVGVPCGVMDQMASMRGAEGKLIFLDTRSLEVQEVPFELAASGLALLVVDSRAPHRLVDGEYAARRRSCEQAAKTLGVRALRDVTVDDLEDALARLPDEEERRRVRHVVTEDARVLAVVALLRSGADPRQIGPALTASHRSMRDDFEITVPEVDEAVEAMLAAGAYGARMTGGGFGGCVIALVEADAADAVADAVAVRFAERGYAAPAPFVAQAARGAHRLR